MRHTLSALLARTAGSLSRRLGRGGGTSLPGGVLLRLDPGAVRHLAGQLNDGISCVSATNGKTTTCRLLNACLTDDGSPLVSNTAGANLLTGVATALLDQTHRHPRPSRALFEVDEAALPEVVRQTRPRMLVLMNLFRDQLDRYGELEAIFRAWTAMVKELPDETILVLNADDPAIAALGAERHNTVYFGIDHTAATTTKLAHAVDSTRCRSCGAPLTYDAVTLAHMGSWWCEACGARRPATSVAATAVNLDGTRSQRIEWRTPHGPVSADLTLPGIHNAYNATAALAAALACGITPEGAAAAISRTDAAFGRAERVTLNGTDVVLMLAKNPAGANTTVQTLLLEENPLHLLVALNDRTADGHDVSWIWDVDYEPLVPRIAQLTVTGDRAYDMALRFAYAGLDRSRIAAVDNPESAFDQALAGTPPHQPLYVLPTYTAMLALRATLVRRGAAEEYWRG